MAHGESEFVGTVLTMRHALEHEKRSRVERTQALIAHPLMGEKNKGQEIRRAQRNMSNRKVRCWYQHPG
jgi:hypothetical protein